MRTIILLGLITVCYAAYNLLVKVSSNHVGAVNTPPIVATIFLQSAALTVSVVYLLYLTRQNVELALPGKAYAWAIAGGVCIGLAEIMYFYLFRSAPGEKAVSASTAIPIIVGGTIIIATVVSWLVFKETLNPGQWIGIAITFAGLTVMAISA